MEYPILYNYWVMDFSEQTKEWMDLFYLFQLPPLSIVYHNLD